MKKLRAHILRKLIAPVNWHRDGICRFPVLCMYDDMLIWELAGYDKSRATWRKARALRQDIDKAFADFAAGRGGRKRARATPELDILISQVAKGDAS